VDLKEYTDSLGNILLDWKEIGIGEIQEGNGPIGGLYFSVNPTNLGKLSGRKLENKCRFCQRNDQFEG
jgi:hypothetical protein